MFSIEERQRVLESICDVLLADEKVASSILVGSGAIGFTDELSDLDLHVMTFETEQVREVFAELKDRVTDLLPVTAYVDSRRGENKVMHHFLLESFLEIDMCILPVAETEAKAPHWRVLFDRTNSVDRRMAKSWEEEQGRDRLEGAHEGYVGAIWHFVLHGVVAAKRGRYWQALSDVERIRSMAAELRGLRTGVRTNRNKDLHEMESLFLERLEGTLVGSLGHAQIAQAMANAVHIFFDEAEEAEAELGLPDSKELEGKLSRLLEEL